MFPHCMIKASVIFLVTVVAFTRCDVMESSSPYSCCGKPSLEFNHMCEAIWNIDNKPIAFYKDSPRSCSPPCLEIDGGLMKLDRCVAVNCTVVCTNEDNLITEESIHYYPQRCSASPQTQGSFGAMLLAVGLAGLFVKEVVA